MKKYYIHKVEKGFTVRCDNVALDEKGEPNAKKPKVFAKEVDARKFVIDQKKPKATTKKK